MDSLIHYFSTVAENSIVNDAIVLYRQPMNTHSEEKYLETGTAMLLK